MSVGFGKIFLKLNLGGRKVKFIGVFVLVGRDVMKGRIGGL